MIRRFVETSIVVSMILGCGGAQPGSTSTPIACAPVDESLPANANIDGLAGDFEMVLATDGPGISKKTWGTLRLEQNDSLLARWFHSDGTFDPNVTVPLQGTADIDLEEVDAVRVGDLMSTDPRKPGVAFLVNRPEGPGTGVSSVTIRFGSIANTRGLTPFDGGFTAARLTQISGGDAFFGTWSSGVNGINVQGYFCAHRVQDS